METEEMLILLGGGILFLKFFIYDPISAKYQNTPTFYERLIFVLKSLEFQIFLISFIVIAITVLLIFLYIKRKKDSKEIQIVSENIKEDSPVEEESSGKPKLSFEKEDEELEQEEVEPTYPSAFEGNYSREVTISVNSDKRYFHKKNISKDEVGYLLREDYQIKRYKNLLTGKMEDFLLQPRHNEGYTHLFLTQNISEYLEKNGIETELYVTKKPDIVFKIKGKMYAIEIETGSIFSKISRMKEKLVVLNNYDKWFFVVTNRNKVKKYKKYGDTVDKRYVKQRIDKLIKLEKNA